MRYKLELLFNTEKIVDLNVISAMYETIQRQLEPFNPSKYYPTLSLLDDTKEVDED